MSFIRRVIKFLSLLKNFLRLRFTSNVDSQTRVRRLIVSQLGDVGGITMKVGQVFADTNHYDEYQPLLTGVPQRKLSKMLSVLEASPKHPCRDDFEHIEPDARAASLGQVHRATLVSGEVVAVKLQYPHIEKTVDAELKLAGLLPGVGPAKRWGMDIDAYKTALANNMHQELDYRREASRQIRFRSQLHIDGLHIPKVYPNLCSKRVLVQQWEDGERFSEVLQWPRNDQMFVARTLLMTLLQSLFQQGEVHGDPHMGNALYRQAETGIPKVVLLDFGCTVSISALQRMSLLKLIVALREDLPVSALDCFVAMGFDRGKLTHIQKELPALSRVLLRPFLTDEPFDVASWQLGRGFDMLLAEKRWWFRSAGPADLFLLMRAFQGVVRQLSQLEVALPWWALLNKAIDADQVSDARNYLLPGAGGDETEAGRASELISNCPSTCLHVQVRSAKELFVDMTFPSEMALELDQIIPEDIQQRIRKLKSFDFEAIHAQLIESRLEPQELFKFDEGKKSYRIWLGQK